MKNELLPEVLQSFDYYKNKLPIYLKEDERFLVHFKNWYDLLLGNSKYSGILNSAQEILELLNIFDNNYLDKIEALEDYTNEESDILDKIALLLGVSRKFSMTYYSKSQSQTVKTDFNLDNENFLILIKAQIIKNYCNGTLSQIQQYYNDVGINLIVYTDSSNSGKCHLCLVNKSGSDFPYNQEILDMLEAGLLNIESVGIKYEFDTQNLDLLLYWDSDELGWNEGEWCL